MVFKPKAEDGGDAADKRRRVGSAQSPRGVCTAQPLSVATWQVSGASVSVSDISVHNVDRCESDIDVDNYADADDTIVDDSYNTGNGVWF